MKNYYISTGGEWFIVRCPTKRKARSEGISEFGRGSLLHIREAREDEIEYFKLQKGDDALEMTLY